MNMFINGELLRSKISFLFYELHLLVVYEHSLVHERQVLGHDVGRIS